MVDVRNEGVNLEFIDALVDDPLANTRPDGYMEQPFIVGATEEETNLIEIARMLVNFLEASEAANVIPVEAGLTSIEIRDAVTTLIEIEQAIVSTVRYRERAKVAGDDPPEGKPRPVPSYLRDPKMPPPFGGGMDTGVFARFVPYLGDALRADDADDIKAIAQIEGMPTLYNLLNDRALFPDEFNPADYLWRPIRFAFAYAKRFTSSPNVGRKVLLFAADKLFSATGIMSFLSLGASAMGMSMNEVVLQMGGLGPDSESGTKAVEAFVEKVVKKLDTIPNSLTGEGAKWQDNIYNAAKYHGTRFSGAAGENLATMKTTAVKFLGSGKVDPNVLLHLDQSTMRRFSSRLMRTFPSTLGGVADGQSTILQLTREVAKEVKGKSGPGRFMMFPLPFSEKQGRAASAMQAMTGDNPTVKSFVDRLGELPGPLLVKGNAVKRLGAVASFAIDHPILFGGGLDVARSIINMILHQNAAKTATILAYGQKIIGLRDMPSGSLLGFVHSDLLNCLASVHRRDANPVRKAEAIRLAGVVDRQKRKLVVIRNALLGKSITNRTYGDLTDLRPPQGTEPDAEKYKRFLKAAKMIEQEVEELNKAMAELKPTSDGPYLGGTVTDCPDGDLEHEAAALGLSVPVVYGDENDTVRPPVDVEEGGGRGRQPSRQPTEASGRRGSQPARGSQDGDKSRSPERSGMLMLDESILLPSSVGCLQTLKASDVRLLHTSVEGDCFYDSIHKIASETRTTTAKSADSRSVRRETTRFFNSNPTTNQRTGFRNAYFALAENMMRDLTTPGSHALDHIAGKSVETAAESSILDNDDHILFHATTAKSLAGAARESSLRKMMVAYGREVQKHTTYANSPEVRAAAIQLNVRICVYRQSGQNFTYIWSEQGLGRGPFQQFHIVNHHPLHFEGLVVYASANPRSGTGRDRTNASAVYGMLTIDEMIDRFKASRV